MIAAGGVVWRESTNETGGVEVLVVHRPHRLDWSLPKGKIEPGESLLETALREVEEETGYRCIPGDDLGHVNYLLPNGRPKTVHWWSMTVGSGAATLNDEVDEIIWLPIGEARGVLGYADDHEMLTRFEAALAQH